MFRELRNNKQGMIFVTVLIIIVVAMVLAVTILSLNISQVKSSEDEFKHLQAKLLAEGGLAIMLINRLSGPPGDGEISYTETLGNTTYTIVSNVDSSSTAPVGYSTNPFTIDVTF
ncbi:MAG: pilus assembly PilX N-terminal domain-containing protein [Candidatus Omnitrophica bacterium]|nr:pilus assembly PilX N-terminal domain-containing protein [Candidatus Omnitrophota bacterium]